MKCKTRLCASDICFQDGGAITEREMDARICQVSWSEPAAVRTQSPHMTPSSVSWGQASQRLKTGAWIIQQEQQEKNHWDLNARHASPTTRAIIASATNEPHVTPCVSRNRHSGSAACKVPLRLFLVSPCSWDPWATPLDRRPLPLIWDSFFFPCRHIRVIILISLWLSHHHSSSSSFGRLNFS